MLSLLFKADVDAFSSSLQKVKFLRLYLKTVLVRMNLHLIDCRLISFSFVLFFVLGY